MSYTIHVQSKDGVSFFVDNLSLEAARVLEAEFVKRFPSFDGYAIATYAMESTMVPCRHDSLTPQVDGIDPPSSCRISSRYKARKMQTERE